MKKVVLYQSTDKELKDFETRYARSLINDRYALIERPLIMSDLCTVLNFSDVNGDGFILVPISVKKQPITFVNVMGEDVKRMGLVVETKTHKHTFYYV